MSSFWPDLIVGVVTGALVAAAVLCAEKRSVRRAAAEAVGRQQENAIEVAQLALRGVHLFPSSGAASLLPAGENMDRLRAAVQAVAPGPTARPVFGYRWVEGAVEAFERVEVLADSITAQVNKYDGWDAGGGIADALFNRIAVIADINEKYAPFPITEPPFLDRWGDGTSATAALNPVAGTLEDDYAFREDVNQYLAERWRLERFRRAFFVAYGGLRADAQAINRRAFDASRGLIGRWFAEQRRRREHSTAMIERTREAEQIVAPTATDR
ncbi:hypothetical protein KZC56_10190 [Microbacterium sp. SSW1-47]|uniref:hypothetical protein n=1 Tax=Microbacterium TaxID=33882 RepID=UPI001FFD526D|nr:hypothetical protein [Microbacterium sufflavum]MCK2026668.1 hypothetical protein [Microbacterium sufflavum]